MKDEEYRNWVQLLCVTGGSTYLGSKFSCRELFVMNSRCRASPCKPGSHPSWHAAGRLAAKPASQRSPCCRDKGGTGNEVTVSGTLLSVSFSWAHHPTATARSGMSHRIFYIAASSVFLKISVSKLRKARNRFHICVKTSLPLHYLYPTTLMTGPTQTNSCTCTCPYTIYTYA